MPPKPPIRTPIKVAPAARSRVIRSPAQNLATPKAASRSLPSQHIPQPPRTSWHRNANLGHKMRWGSYYILGLCGILWLRDHYIDFTHVRGVSMAPTLNPRVHETGEKDFIMIQPYLPRRDGAQSIQRGDIVTFWKPRKPEEMGIKRVIATEGDIVYPTSGYAVDSDNADRLSGVPDGLPDLDEDSIASEREQKGRVVVPYGHVWVEGDNSAKSLDSRDNGPIAKGLIIGKATWIWRGRTEFARIGDARSAKEKRLGSRVVEGETVIPERFLD